jgi:hypothetical protein
LTLENEHMFLQNIRKHSTNAQHHSTRNADPELLELVVYVAAASHTDAKTVIVLTLEFVSCRANMENTSLV